MERKFPREIFGQIPKSLDAKIPEADFWEIPGRISNERILPARSMSVNNAAHCRTMIFQRNWHCIYLHVITHSENTAVTDIVQLNMKKTDGT